MHFCVVSLFIHWWILLRLTWSTHLMPFWKLFARSSRGSRWRRMIERSSRALNHFFSLDIIDTYFTIVSEVMNLNSISSEDWESTLSSRCLQTIHHDVWPSIIAICVQTFPIVNILWRELSFIYISFRNRCLMGLLKIVPLVIVRIVEVTYLLDWINVCFFLRVFVVFLLLFLRKMPRLWQIFPWDWCGV